jgi:hypothetical protein
MVARAIMLSFFAVSASPLIAHTDDTPPRPAMRELCSERPGLATAACTVDPGHVQLELGLADWTLDRTEAQRQDRIDLGEVLLRYGLGKTTEVQFGWTAYAHVRTLDHADGRISTAQDVGDVTIGVKQNLRHPAEGKIGFAMAALPFVTVPTGKAEIGDGDWSAGLILPMSYKFSDVVSFAISPEVDAAADEDGEGRHLSYGAAFGFQVHVAKSVRLSPELQIVRDDDPDKSMTMSSASLSLDVRLKKMTQLDIQAIAGLNQDTPDIRLLAGVTHKF